MLLAEFFHSYGKEGITAVGTVAGWLVFGCWFSVLYWHKLASLSAFQPTTNNRQPTELQINQTGVKLCFDGFSVKMLTYEDDFLHTVTIYLVPITEDIRILQYKLIELFLRHRGIPLSGISETYLLACLLEYIADMRLVSEIA